MDRVFSNGRIWTGRRYVEHLVVEGGRIVAAGPGPVLGRAIPTGADRTDLGGALVLPGFLDAHLHLTSLALRSTGVDLIGARSFDEIGARIHRWTERNPSGAIWGGGWDEERLREGRAPTRRELDRWSPDRPLALSRVCGHVAAVNSAAFGPMRLEAATQDPPGGRFDRDRAGEPTGLLRESALSALERFPHPTLSDRPELGERVLRQAARLGIVALGSMLADRTEVEWAARRPAKGTAAATPRYRAFGRVSALSAIDGWGEARRHWPEIVSGVKIVADGSLGARSAWLSDPYQDAPGSSGMPVFPPGDWNEAIARADVLDLRVAAHAIGDRALRTVVEAIEATRPRCRPRIEHASLAPPEWFGRIRSSGADLVVQPGFRTSDRWLPARIGPHRLPWAYPLPDLRAGEGAGIAGSSDAPVEPLDPLEGIRSAVDPSGIGGPLGVPGALDLYTSGGATVLGYPDLGHLEPGASANFVILDLGAIEELPRAGPGALRDTFIDGRSVRDAAG